MKAMERMVIRGYLVPSEALRATGLYISKHSVRKRMGKYTVDMTDNILYHFLAE